MSLLLSFYFSFFSFSRHLHLLLLIQAVPWAIQQVFLLLGLQFQGHPYQVLIKPFQDLPFLFTFFLFLIKVLIFQLVSLVRVKYTYPQFITQLIFQLIIPLLPIIPLILTIPLNYLLLYLRFRSDCVRIIMYYQLLLNIKVWVFHEVFRVYFYCNNWVFLLFLRFFTINLDHWISHLIFQSYLYFYCCKVSFTLYLGNISQHLNRLSTFNRHLRLLQQHLSHFFLRLLFAQLVLSRYLFIKSFNLPIWFLFVVTKLILLHHCLHQRKSQPNSLIIQFLPYLII